MRINYLYQSGFYVELDNCCLLFNYTGGAFPSIPKSKTLYVFLSSCSADHFDNTVFHYGAKKENIYYIVAKDGYSKKFKMKFFFNTILEKKTREKITWAEANQSYIISNIRVRAINSTDNNHSLAYLVECGNNRIFHAGYLNDWSWPNEPDEFNSKSKSEFQREVKQLKDKHIDAAFLILDPKQESMYADGFDYIMRNCDIENAYPMNFKDDTKIINFLLEDEISEPYRSKIRRTNEHTYRKK